MKDKSISNCCKFSMHVGGDDQEGTHYYVCDKCGKPCDPAPLKQEKVKIICPSCEKTCNAVEEYYEGEPFWSLSHICEHCGYYISESEWTPVDEEVGEKRK